MSAHSLGPWLLNNESGNVFGANDVPICAVAMAGRGGPVAANANARLIAAAPELLSALRELLTLGQQESIEDGELEAAQKAARAAIRKATGGAP